jgi:ATPase subunit of ABC transporter with duplicated ATPase domains
LIQIIDLELLFPHKVCFKNFSTQIPYGSRIAIIGRNGEGQTTLLKIIAGQLQPSEGVIRRDLSVGYVPQIIENYTDLSGGERLNRALTEVLSQNPDILLLDEPTNHLDQHNRKGLKKRLSDYSGTLIVVSHDTELLRCCTDTLWHIEHGKIHVFSGHYDDYIHETKRKRSSIADQLTLLNRQKKEVHTKLMKEQQRASKSKAKGQKNVQNRKWTKMTGDLKMMKSEKSQGKKLKAMDQTKK